MNKYIEINVSHDFTDAPGARNPQDGPDSGEVFYNRLLLPKFEEALKTKSILLVDMDGTFGYATSFISESFGSLSMKFGPELVLKNIKIKSDEDDGLKTYIKSTIKNPEKA